MTRARQQGQQRKKLASLTDDQRQLVEDSTGIIAYALKRWSHLVRAIESRAEAESLARLAMCVAARRYCAKRGTYATYALAWIKGFWLTAAAGGGDLVRIKSRPSDRTPRFQLASLDGESSALRDFLPARQEAGGLDPLERQTLQSALAQLRPRQRLLLQLRFERNLNWSQIGTRLRVSRVRAQQLYRNTLRDLAKLLVYDADGLHALEERA